MPLYFFNARIAGETILDPDGREMPDADAAWEAARVTIASLLSADATPGLLAGEMDVTDADGDVVFTFPFSEALGHK